MINGLNIYYTSKNIGRGLKTINNKPYISAKCNICKKMKSKFVSVKEINGSGFLSNIFKNIPVLNTIF